VEAGGGGAKLSGHNPESEYITKYPASSKYIVSVSRVPASFKYLPT
jgi:hypothetical protein